MTFFLVHLDDLGGVAHVAISELADMHEAVLRRRVAWAVGPQGQVARPALSGDTQDSALRRARRSPARMSKNPFCQSSGH